MLIFVLGFCDGIGVIGWTFAELGWIFAELMTSRKQTALFPTPAEENSA